MPLLLQSATKQMVTKRIVRASVNYAYGKQMDNNSFIVPIITSNTLPSDKRSLDRWLALRCPGMCPSDDRSVGRSSVVLERTDHRLLRQFSLFETEFKHERTSGDRRHLRYFRCSNLFSSVWLLVESETSRVEEESLLLLQVLISLRFIRVAHVTVPDQSLGTVRLVRAGTIDTFRVSKGNWMINEHM